MSSILYKSLQTARIPLVRYSARSKRLNKAEVQLLRDFPNVGVAGQIVKVSHSLMRNTLHRENGATYILPDKGPTIPVVTPKRHIPTPEPQEAKVVAPEPQFTEKVKPEIKPKKEVKIEGLLLNIPSNATPTTNITTSDSLSLFKLSRELTHLTINKPGSDAERLATPLKKSNITSTINKTVSSKVTDANLEVKSLTGETIETIETFGTYKLLVWKDDEHLDLELIVKAA